MPDQRSYSALYYPYTDIRNVPFLTASLLLWDRIIFIHPWEGFKPNTRNSLVEEAMELVGHPHVPTEAEKLRAHTMIAELAEKELPEVFYYHYDSNDRVMDKVSVYPEYGMWPEKLMPATWEFLRERRMAERKDLEYDWFLPEMSGFSLMCILADCCADTSLTRITDRSFAYASITNILNADRFDTSMDYVSAVALSFRCLGTKNISLKAAIDLRKREERSRSSDYRKMRHHYLDEMSKYLQELRSCYWRDVNEVNFPFEKKMEDDLKDLKIELGLAKQDALLTKEGFFVTLAGAALAASAGPYPAFGVSTLGGAAVAIGGIWSARNRYVRARRELLRTHPMAYLYLT